MPKIAIKGYLGFLLMTIKTNKASINITVQSLRYYTESLLFEEKAQICREISVFKLQHSSVLKAQPQQHISNIYIYQYVSDQW